MAASSANANSANSAAEYAHQLAELELLGQNQRKLGSLTQRMTSILSGFDRRLVKLENTILPIHKSTQSLLRVESNIDATLAALNKTLGHYDVVQDEEPLIRKGPSVRDTRPYMATIQRVQGGLEYLQKSDLKSQQGVMAKMHDLIEIGSRKLASVVKDWVEAESQEIIDPLEFVSRGTALPTLSSATVDAIGPILSFLRTLPVNPSTMHDPQSSALTVYADIRGKYVRACLEPVGQGVEAFARERVAGFGASAATRAGMVAAWDDEDGQYVRGSSGAAQWMSAFMDMIENEYSILSSLLASLNPPGSSKKLSNTLAVLLRPALSHFSVVSSTLLNEVRRNIGRSPSHICFALDVLGAFGSVQGRWQSVVVRGTGADSGSFRGLVAEDGSSLSPQALFEAMQALRTAAMGVFPSFIQDIKALPQKREGEVPSTTVNEITYSGLTFMKHIAEYGDVVAPLLQTLGAGNWLMGSGGAPVLSLGGIDGGADEDETILSQYLSDALAAVLDSLEARSRAIRQQSTASVFLLNNLAFLRREVVNSILSQAMGQLGEQLLQGALSNARSQYLEAWTPLASAISEDFGGQPGSAVPRSAKLGGGGDKSAVKDRFAKFYEGLDDIERLHRAYPLLRDDAGIKEQLRHEVSRFILPQYARFVAKHRAGDFSKNPSKHIRMTEAEVEERLNGLYQ